MIDLTGETALRVSKEPREVLAVALPEGGLIGIAFFTRDAGSDSYRLIRVPMVLRHIGARWVRDETLQSYWTGPVVGDPTIVRWRPIEHELTVGMGARQLLDLKLAVREPGTLTVQASDSSGASRTSQPSSWLLKIVDDGTTIGIEVKVSD